MNLYNFGILGFALCEGRIRLYVYHPYGNRASRVQVYTKYLRIWLDLCVSNKHLYSVVNLVWLIMTECVRM